MPSSGWVKMTEEERSMARHWYSEGKSPSEIASLLDRDASTLTRLLCKQQPAKRQGRPCALTDAKVDYLERKLDEMIVKADGQKVVTVEALKKATKTSAGVQTILAALHKRNIYFRRLREKPVLTPADVQARRKFAQTYRKKTRAWPCIHRREILPGRVPTCIGVQGSLLVQICASVVCLCAHDGSGAPASAPRGHSVLSCQVYLTGAERARAAKHGTFGAYRRPGKGLCAGYVKPKEGSLRHNTGAKGVLLQVGVGGGKVVAVHEVKSRWNGQAAVTFYEALRRGLERACPGKLKYTILEDNDPTGYKSAKGRECRCQSEGEAAKLDVMEIPKRSPDLSLLDYAVWKEVNQRLRRQEKTWPRAKRETRQSYVQRLKRTIRSLPNSIGDMVRRCERLHEAKGHFFEEGGRGA
ncbi:F52C9.6 [Symbiodinium pilosum]|uniref:F52C9.6 protein n=1 Tax=Symbiodinium pilosum TaxID=2952 RepID=A0A812T184_SYMPI|nr:F52C9.6 [Symbiodinium pilosum]